MVYILNTNGEPLMPTKRFGKVRRLLKQGLAKVAQTTPFTIQLLYDSTTYTQPISLGVDAGSKKVGLSAATAKEELFATEAQLRQDMVDLLSTRSQYRRARRSRKTRYRKARFLNRSKPKGWLAPSVQHKVDCHLKLIAEVHKILPIIKIVAEVASFDIQKIKNPDISSIEYQQGEQMGFWNVREYVLFRDGHRCQHCKGKSKDKILNVHHIESRKTGGDAPNNLVTLCETCHDKHHKGEISLKAKRSASFRDTAFMGIMRWAFYDRLKELYPNVSLTYGYITKNARIKAGLVKGHSTDAFCISGNMEAKRAGSLFLQKFVRKSNRSLHKATIAKGGNRKANKAPYVVHGYRLFDKVLYDKRQCFVFGRRTRGYFDLRLLDGESVNASASYKKLRLLQVSDTLLTERRAAISPTG